MPLADIPGVIAGLAEAVCQGHRIVFEGQTVAIDTALGGVKAGLQTGPGRRADRLAGKGIEEMGTPLSHPIEVRHQFQGIAVQTRGVPALLVCEEHNHVWLFFHIKAC